VPPEQNRGEEGLRKDWRGGGNKGGLFGQRRFDFSLSEQSNSSDLRNLSWKEEADLTFKFTTLIGGGGGEKEGFVLVIGTRKGDVFSAHQTQRQKLVRVRKNQGGKDCDGRKNGIKDPRSGCTTCPFCPTKERRTGWTSRRPYQRCSLTYNQYVEGVWKRKKKGMDNNLWDWRKGYSMRLKCYKKKFSQVGGETSNLVPSEGRNL